MTDNLNAAFCQSTTASGQTAIASGHGVCPSCGYCPTCGRPKSWYQPQWYYNPGPWSMQYQGIGSAYASNAVAGTKGSCAVTA
jgi:hypothetical protein